MYYDVDYAIDSYNFQTKRKKFHNPYEKEYPENMNSSDHITDKDDSYEDEEYAHD